MTKLYVGLKRNCFIAISFALLITLAIPVSAAQINNLVSIGDATLGPGENITLPITISNATGVAAVGLKLSYTPSVVNVTDVTQGDFTSFFAFDSSNAANGRVIINTFIMGTQLTGNLTIANVTLEAKGSSGESPLNIEIMAVSNKTGYGLFASTDNGTFKIRSQTYSPQSSSGSGGGGGGGTSDEDFNNIELREKYDHFIYKDKVTSYCFRNAGNPIICINITGNVNAGEINTAVEVLRNISSLVKTSPEGIVYKNLNIWVGTYGFATPKNIKDAVITFRVDRSWIDKNNIDPASVMIERYSSGWNALPTEKIGENDIELYYKATTNSFSPFVIIGEGSGIPGISQINPVTSGAPAQQENLAGEPKSLGSSLSIYLLISIAVVCLICGIIIHKIRKSKQKENKT